MAVGLAFCGAKVLGMEGLIDSATTDLEELAFFSLLLRSPDGNDVSELEPFEPLGLLVTTVLKKPEASWFRDG